MKEGKWEAYSAKQTRLRNGRLASNSQPLSDYHDLEYTANVSIGTPPQHFIVLLDLMTNIFWVPDKTCAVKTCPSLCKDPGTLPLPTEY
ncbi:aspartic protease 2B [Aphelenchoides avenae]|nr:aspartic protease 2B [Aphelenchus avenae]